MPATRRVFLRNVAATAVVSAGSLRSWSQKMRDLTTEEQIGRETLGTATAQTWEQWIGASFKVTWGGMKVGTLVLESVETDTFPVPKEKRPQSPLMPVVPVRPVAPLMPMAAERVVAPGKPVVPGTPAPPATPGTELVRETESTMLVFRTNGKPFIQEVYTLQHDWLGTFNLLLVPASPATAGSEYTAVITRLTGRMVPMQ